MKQPPPMPIPAPDGTTRVGWIDIFRGIAILLVVIGHTARGLDHAKILPGYEESFIDDWIYAFHMPAFFFAAGLFAFHSLQRGTGRFVGDKVRTVLWPYFVWSALFLLSLMVLTGSTTAKYQPDMWWKLPFQPVGNYWFLHALFGIQMLYLIAAIPGGGRRLFWWLAVVLWAVEPWKPFDHVVGTQVAGVFHQMMRYAIYFAFGDWAAWRTADEYRQPRDCRIFAVIEFALMTLLVAMGHSYEDRWWALPLAIAGIQGLWEVSVAMDQTAPHTWLQFLGKRSLEIYVAHNFACVAVRLGLVKMGITSPVVHLPLGVLAGVAMPLLLWWICVTINFPYLFALKKYQTRNEPEAETG